MNTACKSSWRTRLATFVHRMPASPRRQRWVVIARLAQQSTAQPNDGRRSRAEEDDSQ